MFYTVEEVGISCQVVCHLFFWIFILQKCYGWKSMPPPCKSHQVLRPQMELTPTTALYTTESIQTTQPNTHTCTRCCLCVARMFIRALHTHKKRECHLEIFDPHKYTDGSSDWFPVYRPPLLPHNSNFGNLFGLTRAIALPNVAQTNALHETSVRDRTIFFPCQLFS